MRKYPPFVVAAVAAATAAFNPSGKLPVTFPKKESDQPADTTARYPGPTGPRTIPRASAAPATSL